MSSQPQIRDSWPPALTKTPTLKMSSATAADSAETRSQVMVTQALADQVECVGGSRDVYRRVDNKLASIEVDPFFYREQKQLFQWRFNFLVNHYLYENMRKHLEKIGILITKKFDQVLENWSLGKQIYNINLSEAELQAGKNSFNEATIIFSFPFAVMIFFKMPEKHDSNGCNCVQCTARLALLNEIMKTCAGVSLVELVIRGDPRHHLSPVSLKEQGMKKVLELGLEEGCLPLTVKEGMRRGPEHKRLNFTGERMLALLQRDIKDITNQEPS